MATQAQADKARAVYADRIAKQGAHAVGVEPGKSHGKSGFVVTAYVEPGKQVELPENLTLENTKCPVDVPLVVIKANLFKAQ